MSNTETLNDEGRLEAVANHNKSMKIEVTPTSINTYINHERAQQEAAETDLEERVDWTETERTCVCFGRVNQAKPSTNESLQVHSGRVDLTTEVKPKWTSYE